MRKSLLGFVLLIITTIPDLFSQQDEQLRSLQQELAMIRAAVDSLKSLHIEESQVEEGGLEEKIENRIRELERNINALARAMNPTVLNPRITAFTNFAARTDDKKVLDAEGTREISNRPFLRSVEIDFRAPVDPYAEAVAVFALEDEAGAGFAVDLEEAYGVLTRLPILDEAPWGIKLKVGKFRAPLGVNNKLHLHDLPWTTRPLVVSRYLGTDHGEFFESGFNPVGVDFDFFLPNPVPSTTLEMNLGVVRAGEIALGPSLDLHQPAYIAHLTLSRDWYNEHLLTFGASGYLERGSDAPRLFGVDAMYKWSPAEQRQWRSVVVGGEFFGGTHTVLDSLLKKIVYKPYGWFGYVQYQLSYWTYIGVRFDWLKEPQDDALVTKSWSAYVSYYTTEFLRLRLGFQRMMSAVSTSEINNVHSLQLEVNFVFGSHPTEPYWVNR